MASKYLILSTILLILLLRIKKSTEGLSNIPVKQPLLRFDQMIDTPKKTELFLSNELTDITRNDSEAAKALDFFFLTNEHLVKKLNLKGKNIIAMLYLLNAKTNEETRDKIYNVLKYFDDVLELTFFDFMTSYSGPNLEFETFDQRLLQQPILLNYILGVPQDKIKEMRLKPKIEMVMQKNKLIAEINKECGNTMHQLINIIINKNADDVDGINSFKTQSSLYVEESIEEMMLLKICFTYNLKPLEVKKLLKYEKVGNVNKLNELDLNLLEKHYSHLIKFLDNEKLNINFNNLLERTPETIKVYASDELVSFYKFLYFVVDYNGDNLDFESIETRKHTHPLILEKILNTKYYNFEFQFYCKLPLETLKKLKEDLEIDLKIKYSSALIKTIQENISQNADNIELIKNIKMTTAYTSDAVDELTFLSVCFNTDTNPEELHKVFKTRNSKFYAYFDSESLHKFFHIYRNDLIDNFGETDIKSIVSSLSSIIKKRLCDKENNKNEENNKDFEDGSADLPTMHKEHNKNEENNTDFEDGSADLPTMHKEHNKNEENDTDFEDASADLPTMHIKLADIVQNDSAAEEALNLFFLANKDFVNNLKPEGKNAISMLYLLTAKINEETRNKICNLSKYFDDVLELTFLNFMISYSGNNLEFETFDQRVLQQTMLLNYILGVPAKKIEKMRLKSKIQMIKQKNKLIAKINKKYGNTMHRLVSIIINKNADDVDDINSFKNQSRLYYENLIEELVLLNICSTLNLKPLEVKEVLKYENVGNVDKLNELDLNSLEKHYSHLLKFFDNENLNIDINNLLKHTPKPIELYASDTLVTNYKFLDFVLDYKGKNLNFKSFEMRKNTHPSILKKILNIKYFDFDSFCNITTENLKNEKIKLENYIKEKYSEELIKIIHKNIIQNADIVEKLADIIQNDSAAKKALNLFFLANKDFVKSLKPEGKDAISILYLLTAEINEETRDKIYNVSKYFDDVLELTFLNFMISYSGNNLEFETFDQRVLQQTILLNYILGVPAKKIEEMRLKSKIQMIKQNYKLIPKINEKYGNTMHQLISIIINKNADDVDDINCFKNQSKLYFENLIEELVLLNICFIHNLKPSEVKEVLKYENAGNADKLNELDFNSLKKHYSNLLKFFDSEKLNIDINNLLKHTPEPIELYASDTLVMHYKFLDFVLDYKGKNLNFKSFEMRKHTHPSILEKILNIKYFDFDSFCNMNTENLKNEKIKLENYIKEKYSEELIKIIHKNITQNADKEDNKNEEDNTDFDNSLADLPTMHN